MRRSTYIDEIRKEFGVNPVVAILGPRQAGKTTLAQQYIARAGDCPTENYFDLEDNFDLQRLENPMTALSGLEGLIVIDEVQMAPELFKVLRVLCDKYREKQRYLILGSASHELLRQSSETLAGRISYIEMMPFNYPEVNDIDGLLVRGGFPRSYLADTDEQSLGWRKSFIKTYLERDIPSLGIQVDPQNMRRFWMMLAHYHGCTFNASEIGRAMQLSNHTVIKYCNILTSTFMIRQLAPWYENIGKRQVKAQKIYFRDVGILNVLLGIKNQTDLLTNPKLGAIWEGFALEEIIRANRAASEDCYFWATHSNAEIDLVMIIDGKKHGFEFKYSDAPKVTKSMKIALHDLSLESISIIYPGQKRTMLDEKISVIGLENYLQEY